MPKFTELTKSRGREHTQGYVTRLGALLGPAGQESKLGGKKQLLNNPIALAPTCSIKSGCYYTLLQETGPRL